jgi:hypothetical protein
MRNHSGRARRGGGSAPPVCGGIDTPGWKRRRDGSGGAFQPKVYDGRSDLAKCKRENWAASGADERATAGGGNERSSLPRNGRPLPRYCSEATNPRGERVRATETM